MIFSSPPSPAEASFHSAGSCQGFAQAGNRFTPRIKSRAGFFGIMLYSAPQTLVKRALAGLGPTKNAAKLIYEISRPSGKSDYLLFRLCGARNLGACVGFSK